MFGTGFTFYGWRKCSDHFIRVLSTLFFAIGYFSSNVCAQDVHFTQFFTTPLILNPAQTGYYNGNYRLGFNFKAQWPWATQQVPFTYHTEAPYVDFSIGENKIKGGWMGIGANFLNDEAGDGRLIYRRLGLSYAYHFTFDRKKRYILSAGASLHYIIRTVDFSSIYFSNQWANETGFDLSLSSGESLTRESFGYLDLAAGMNFGAQVSDRLKLDMGFCILHINRPSNSFLGKVERLGFRYQGNMGINYKLLDRLSWSLHAYYGFQKRASETLFGTLFGYGVKPRFRSMGDHVLYFGAYYRLLDAAAPVLGYSYKQTRLLLNYDITLSKLFVPGRANGGPELSFVHVGRWSKSKNTKINCPVF